MWNNVIGEQIRRANRNLLVCNAVVLLLVIGWFSLSFRALYNQFEGPETIEVSDLVKITAPQKRMRYWFKIKRAKITEVIYSRYWVSRDRNTNEEKSRTLQAVYQMLLGRGALIPVSASNPIPEGEVQDLTGALVPMQADVLKQMQSFGGGVLAQVPMPVMLDTGRFQGGEGYWPLLFMLPPLGISLWNLKKGMARKEDYLLHPIAQQLKKYGDPRELGGLIEQEARDATSVFNLGGLTITRNWILSRHPWGLEVRKLDDLVWSHRLQTNHSVNFIPTGKTQSVLFYFNDKSKFSVSPDLKGCDKILAVLSSRTQGAYVGYSDQLAAIWNKKPQDIIDQVAKNKVEIKEQAKAKAREAAEGKKD